MAKQSRDGVDRRAFLTGVATAGAAAVASAAPSSAAAAEAGGATAVIPPPSAALAQADMRALPPAAPDRLHVANPGSDYMVDVVRALDIDYLATMPGSTFRGIHESFINYGGNTKPELITVVHEEISAGVAHGYAKAAGKPMAVLVHNTVGLQHASMAIYNAWCDRVPMLVLVGNILDGAKRRPGVEWDHTAVDVAAIVRGYVKYDDSPDSLDSFRESTTRGFQLATTPPCGPALVLVDGDLAESPIGTAKPAPVTPYHRVRFAAGDPNAVDEAAKLLVNAQNPVIIAGRVGRTAAAMPSLVQLAELLQVPVVDDHTRMSFPTTHYLGQSYNRAVINTADVVLALEVGDLFGFLEDVPDLTVRRTVRRIKDGTKVIEINSELAVGAGNYQDKQRFYPSDLPIDADAEATLPLLIDAVQRNLTPARRALNDDRAAHWKAAYTRTRLAARDQAAIGWDASPISVARLCMEVWQQIKGMPDWQLASGTGFQSQWPQRLWDFTAYTQWIGESGGGGVGYSGPGAVGAALAAKGTGRFVVGILGDGELMCAPGCLWTLAHHRLPMLAIMHNNRAWHQEHMHVQRMADRRDRDPSKAYIATVIDDPPINYAKMAESFGLYAEGPISDPAQLAPALARAIAVVKSGHPAMVDVLTQPR